jgi:hypothetical protein
MSYLTVFLNRKNTSLPVDKITVDKKGDFSLEYYDAVSNLRELKHMNVKEITSYFYRLFDLLLLDDEPFHTIQFSIPTYPSILLEIRKLTRSKIDDFMDVFKNILDEFPVISSSSRD